MRVVFEENGWQLRQLSPDTAGVYVVHKQCAPYAYYIHNYKCDKCNAPIPKSIQALAVLYTWDN